MPNASTLAPSPPALTRSLLLVLAACTGLAVANIYYNQPMLGLIGGALRIAPAWVAASTQLGYAAGLLFIVPLGDRLDRRRLVLWQTLFLVIALAAAALAPTGPALIAASVAVGIGSTIAQLLIPIAATLADPAARGRVIGTMMSGLLAGILLARTLSGLVAAAAGWRAMFWLGSAIAIAMAGVLARSLPHVPATTSISFPALMRSLGTLYRRHPALRRAGLVQACLFGGFSAFWSTLALFLAKPPYHLGAATAGLYGLIGVSGIIVAPVAGRLSDRHGPGLVGRVGILLVIGAYGAMLLVPGLVALGLAVVAMDAGVQATMVSNQTEIFGLGESERNRINTIYVVNLFLGGAIGSALGGLAWDNAGWPGVMGFSICAGVLALLVHSMGRRGT